MQDLHKFRFVKGFSVGNDDRRFLHLDSGLRTVTAKCHGLEDNLTALHGSVTYIQESNGPPLQSFRYFETFTMQRLFSKLLGNS
jgi:hypothetical protein